MKGVNLGTIWLAFGLAMACGGTNEDLAATAPDTTAADSAQPTQAEELHAFEYAGTRYTILEVDGELLTTFSHPRYAPIPHVVAADGGELTLLEKYLAFEPGGEPDPRLVEDHARAAELLGRPDASIHAARVELLEQTVNKGLAERDQCVTAAAGFTGGTFVAPHYTKSGEVSVLNGTFTSARAAFPNGERGDMLLLACNFNAGAQTETVEFAKKTGTGLFILQFTRNIAADNTEGIIQNTGNGITRFNLRMRVTTTPNVPMVGGVFAEARP